MSVFEELKSVGKVLQEAGKIEQYQQILETQEKLLEMQNKISQLEEENRELKEKIKIKENLIYENNCYWMKKNGEKDGPFCSHCWDKVKHLIRMHPCGNTAYSYCSECKNQVQIGPDHAIYRPKNPRDSYHL